MKIKKYFSIIFFSLFFNSTFAQINNSVIVYLKNGSEIKGKVKSERPNLKIETFDKSIWAFGETEIEKVTISEPENLNIRYKHKGFLHFTELGPLAYSNRASNGITTSAFSFQTTNGYKFNQWFFTGIAVGTDLYAVKTFVPIMLSVRGDFTSKGDKIPFYFLESGYGFNATSNDVKDTEFKGGFAFAGGIGLKLLFANNSGFVIGAGYRFQQSSDIIKKIETKDNFNRLTLRVGFSF